MRSMYSKDRQGPRRSRRDSTWCLCPLKDNFRPTRYDLQVEQSIQRAIWSHEDGIKQSAVPKQHATRIDAGAIGGSSLSRRVSVQMDRTTTFSVKISL
jgi:hypothetical protein